MECVQHYLNVCVDQQERKIIENEVYGAKRLYEFLCGDRSFQQGKQEPNHLVSESREGKELTECGKAKDSLSVDWRTW